MCRKKPEKREKSQIFFKKVRQDLKSQKNAKNAEKCQMTSKTPNSPKFALEKRHLATLLATRSRELVVALRAAHSTAQAKLQCASVGSSQRLVES
jgi:hypothetical protein